ncbi:MAG: S8 family peptidase [Chloroflexi bacterium]|nr:S8 family peptidase [Chloroflexota bacterium]
MDGFGVSASRGRRWLRWPAVALAAALNAIIALSSGAISAAGNVHGAVYDWARANPGQDVHVLVQTDGDSEAVADFIRSSGGTVQREFLIIPAVEADVSPTFVSTLAGHSDVAWISLDAPVVSTGGGDTVDTKNLATAYPYAVNAPDVWNGDVSRTGRGVTVAVVDTGITNDNKDFKEGKKSRVLFDVAVNPLATDFDDGFGHGTHVAGIIGGDGDALKQEKYIGIAPDASFVDVKLSDDDGNATLADVIAGLEFAYLNKDTYNIRVVNLSLTSSVAQSYTVDPLDAAVEFLWFNGIVVVVAAGNLGDAAAAVFYPPANDPFVIVTGAFDDMGTPDKADDALASWSSRGITQDGFSKPDVVAPGRRIISDIDTDSFLAQTYPDRVVDKKYFRMSGTSMSAPVISGMVALILEEHPEFTPGQVKYVLQDSFRYVDGFKAPLADQSVFFNGTPGNTDIGLTPSYLFFRPAVVVPVGVVAFVLGADDPVAEAQRVGLDLEAAGIAGANLDTVDWGAIKWDAIKWGAIKWGAIKWSAIKWSAFPE